MFTAVRKTKLSAQNKDHNKWILWCVYDEKFKRVSLG